MSRAAVPYNNATGPGAASITTGSVMRFFDDFTTEIDLQNSGSFATPFANKTLPYDGQPARAIMVTDLGAGTLLAVRDINGNEIQIDVTNLVGALLPMAIIAITDNTDIGAVLVFW